RDWSSDVCSSDLRCNTSVPIQAGSIWRIHVAFQHRVVDGTDLFRIEGSIIVELGYFPWLACSRIGIGIARLLIGFYRDGMSAKVIRVRVTTDFIVSHHDVGFEVPNHTDQWGRSVFQ